jgi:hypothetical protein
MPRRLTLDEAAAELHKTRRWLLDWLRANPRDGNGQLFYTPAGRDKLLHDTDIARIEIALREGKTCRSNSGRRGPVKRRISRSAGPTEAPKDHSELKQLAELLGDPTLLSSSAPSRTASTSTAAGRRQKLRLIQGSPHS